MLDINEDDTDKSGGEDAVEDGIEGRAELSGHCKKNTGREQFNRRIPNGDPRSTVAALASQEQKGKNGEEIKRPQAVFAPGAIRPSRGGEAPAARKPPDHYIEKGADNDAAKEREAGRKPVDQSKLPLFISLTRFIVGAGHTLDQGDHGHKHSKDD